MSQIPYYLSPTVPGVPGDRLFDINITTELPDGINWDTTQVESVWDTASEGFGSLASNVLDVAFVVPKTLFSEGSTLFKDVSTGLADSAASVADTILGTLSKYFIFIAGVIVVMIYVAGKSGAINFKSVM